MSERDQRSPDPRLVRRRPTDQELDAEATLTPDDVTDAVRTFNRYAPPEGKGLLSAREDKT